MNEDAFLRALRDDPGDELTWQALADFLDDSGQPDRAELLRLTRRLRSTPADGRADLRRRVAELLEAGARPVIVERVNSLGMRFVLVPPGRFLMGSPDDEEGRSDNEHRHEVELTRPFWLCAFAVTQGQWNAVMRDKPSWFRPGGGGREKVSGMDVDDFPVEQVTWEDVQRFFSALGARGGSAGNYRLPTEAEWEYACRAGGIAEEPFCFRSPCPSLAPAQANFDGRHPFGARKGPYLARTARVGSYEPNPLGIHDMHGNVWEWCHDWFDSDYYRASPPRDPPGPASGTIRVIRGGSYSSQGRNCRAATRLRYSPAGRYRSVGFRAVWTPSA